MNSLKLSDSDPSNQEQFASEDDRRFEDAERHLHSRKRRAQFVGDVAKETLLPQCRAGAFYDRPVDLEGVRTRMLAHA